jgi:ABC-type multidrug transport system fused ATPase/permease subunit
VDTGKEPSISIRDLVKTFMPFIRPHLGWVWLDIICTIGGSAIAIANAYFLGALINAALDNQFQQMLNNLYWMTGFTILNIIISYCSRYAYASYGAYTIRDLRNHLVEHISNFPVEYMENVHSGHLVSRVSYDTWGIQVFLESGLSQFVVRPLTFIAISIYMLFIDWRLLILGLMMIPLTMITAHIMSKPMERYNREIQENWAQTSSILQDTIGGIYILKAFNLLNPLYKRYKKLLGERLDKNLSIMKRQSFASPVSSMLNIIPTVLYVMYGGYLSIKGELNPGQLMTSLQLLERLNGSASFMPDMIFTIRSLKGRVQKLIELIKEPVERTDGCSFHPESSRYAIEFDKVKFSYDQNTTILEDMSFGIPFGKTVALVGPSGTGKSTIFKLLCGYYHCEGGTIRLFGKDFNEWSLWAVRSQLSLVSQDTYLYPTTVKENIAYGRQDASFEEIVEAAKAANAHHFIQELPQGYDTLVGERGVRLSGGQKQRISIARAILKDAPVLLLDEPTSALDTQSEALVQQALDQFMKGRTVLVIAHRLSTIKNVDEVLVMDQGRIVERGTHDQLMQKGGLYQNLYLKQFQGLNSDNTKADREGA